MTQSISKKLNNDIITMPLKGKRMLLIGARNGVKSVSHIITAVNAGAEHVYMAIHPSHVPIISSILSGEDYASSIQEKIQLLVIQELCPSFLKRSEDSLLDNTKVQLIASLLRQKAEEGGNGAFRIDACISYQEDLLQVTADLQDIFQVPGCYRPGVAATINKYLFRKVLKEQNLGRAYYASLDEFLKGKADPRMKFPLVIKPTEGAGSAGVFLVYCLEELLEKVHAYELSRERRHKSPLVPYDKWLVEEFLQGPELGVELIMSHGECIFASVMEVVKTPPPVFQGTGRHYPTSLGDDRDKAVMDECIKAAKSLGLNNSVIDIDAKYVYEADGTPRGPVIIEINCRMGGHSVSVMHQQVFGIDLVLEHMRCGVGEQRHSPSALPYAIPPEKKTWYTKILLSKKSGIFTLHNNDFLDLLNNALSQDMKELLQTAWLGRDPGFRVDSELIPVILAFVVATGSTLQEAKKNANKMGRIGSRITNEHIAREVDGILEYDSVEEEKKEGGDEPIVLPSAEVINFISNVLHVYFSERTKHLFLNNLNMSNDLSESILGEMMDDTVGSSFLPFSMMMQDAVEVGE